MKKNWKNRSGVSPVIATILLVAITVILSSVVYIMVMNLGERSDPAPSGAYASAEKLDSRTIKFKLGVMDRDVGFTECKFIVGFNYTMAEAQSIVGTGSGNALSFKLGETSDILTVTFVDLNGDSKVGMGDYAEIVTNAGSLAPGMYTASLLWAQDGTQIRTMALPN